ncbi:MAG: amino acid permease [Planctomycetales bacterium]|nr:amino acid permease [Planctomycetales bacterium]
MTSSSSSPDTPIENARSSEPGASTLTTWDAVSLIIGIVIGSTVFKTSGLIFANVPGPWWGLGLWIVCGGLSFASALCYAELATAYPRLGGEYNYLTRAFGPWAGFLFGWAELSMIQTGSIGALSYVFAEHAVTVFALPSNAMIWLALAAVVVLTTLNMLGVQAGKRTQNMLTIAKLIGMGLLVIAGLSVAGSSSLAVAKPMSEAGWPFALILVLYAYGGWNDAAFVAAEMKDRSRNIPRALLLGIGVITVWYVLLNAAYLGALGFEGLRASHQPAADAFAKVVGARGGRAMIVLVMISALGSVNGVIFSAARLHATVGADHRLFALLAKQSPHANVPARSLLVQGGITVAMILALGTDAGRSTLDAGLVAVGATPVPWGKYFGGFETLYAASAPIFWSFFLATGVAYFVLRWKDRDIERPFRAPLFPLCPLLFCAMSGFGLYSATLYAWPLLPLIAVPFLLGVPLYFVSIGISKSQ